MVVAYIIFKTVYKNTLRGSKVYFDIYEKITKRDSLNYV